MRRIWIGMIVTGTLLIAASITIVLLSGSPSSLLSVPVGLMFAGIAGVNLRKARVNPETVPAISAGTTRLVLSLMIVSAAVAVAVLVLAVVASLSA
jgi:hypothetical protein